MGQVEIGLIIFALIIGVGFFANFIFQRTKFPDIIWLLFIGLLLGPISSVYGYDIVSSQALLNIAPLFGAIALMMILFEGGLGMDIYKLVKEAAPAFLLTSLGIIFSSIAVGGLIYLYSIWQGIGLSFLGSLILGIIVGGTSSAIVVPTIMGMKGLKQRPSMILSLESVMTDPFVIIIALVLMETAITQSGSYSLVFSDIISSFSISVVVGFIAGMIWAKILPKFNKYEYHHMLTIAFLFLLYTLGEVLGASGAIIAFTIGVVIGNSKKIKDMLKLKGIVGLSPQTRKFNSLISFFIRTFFFVFIGALVTFENPWLFAIGIFLSFVMLGARWLVLKIIRTRMKLEARDYHIMLYMYPRGLAAAVLASSPLLTQIPGTSIFIEIVFAVILTTIIISTYGVMTLDRKHPIKKD